MEKNKMSSVLAVVMAIFLILSGLSLGLLLSNDNTASAGEETAISFKPVSNADLRRLQEKWGVRDPNVNYNKLYDGKGTGLAPPTMEQYDKMASTMKVSEDGTIFIVGDNEESVLASPSGDSENTLLARKVFPEFTFMPPMGNQGQQGSCAAWGASYYQLSIMIAQDYGYDINTWGTEIASSTVIPTHGDKIMSPGWSYNMVAGGEDGGSNWFGLWDLSKSVGNSNYATQPYDDGDFTTWGDETAFRNAAQYRSTGYEWYDFEKDMAEGATFNQVETKLKTYLDNNYAIGFGIDADAYPTDNCGRWQGDPVVSSTDWGTEAALNHAQTVIGYDDAMADGDGTGETGAFLVANSWGDWGPYAGQADTGTYWMTYELFINHLMLRTGYVLTGTGVYDSTAANSPQLLATWDFSTRGDRDPDVELGIANTDGGDTVVDERIPIWDGASRTLRQYPAFLAVDITEYIPTWNNADGANFFSLYTGASTGTASTISAWNVEHYNGGYVWNDAGASATRVSCTSPDAPANNPSTMWTTFTSPIGKIYLDQEKYAVEDTITIYVEDEDLIGAGSVDVTITSPIETETVTLSVGRYTHVYTGSITCSATNSVGVLAVAAGDTVTAEYNDGGTPRTASGTIDATAPVIATGPTAFTKIGAVIEWTSDELATSRVRYGLEGGPLNLEVYSDKLTYNHRVALDRLDITGKSYIYEIEMVNEAGLTGTYSNAGWTFVTTNFDDVENGNVGWSFEPMGARSKGRWDVNTLQAKSGTYSWNLGNTFYGGSWCENLTSPIIQTTGWDGGEWRWWHYYITEAPDGTDYWDGFVVDVRYSNDGGASWSTWERATPDTNPTADTANGFDGLGTGYDGFVYADYTDTPLAGEEIFGGDGGGWKDERVNLAPWLPADFIQVKYYFASDAFVEEYGVDIDNIMIKGSAGTPPSITVTAPSGGEILNSGSNYDITWSTIAGDGIITGVDLAYSIDGGTTYTAIANGVADTGIYTWTVPNENSDQCVIKATVNADDGLSGSDISGLFTISGATPPTMDLTRPDGGEVFKSGYNENITWTATAGDGTITSVSLWYSTNAGATWTEIATGLPNDGLYTWQVPNEPSTECLVRATVYDDLGSEDTDESLGYFEIEDFAPVNVTLYRPIGGESWLTGNVETIEWNTDAGDYSRDMSTDLVYSIDGGATWLEIAYELVLAEHWGNHTYNWTVPDHNSNLCRVRVTSGGRAIVGLTFDQNSDSSGNFTITGTPAAAPTNLTVEHTGSAGETTTETRYMRSDDVLGTTRTSTELSTDIYTGGANQDGGATVEWGIRVWAGATELTGGTPEAIVSRAAAGQGLQSATWNCPETAIADTDTVTVSVYAQIVTRVGWTLQNTFETEALGADQLDGATWTVNYYTSYEGEAGGAPGGRYTQGWFHWGIDTHDSRVDAFAHSTIGGGLGTDDNAVNWTASLEEPTVTGYNIYRSNSSIGPWTLIDTVAADGGPYSYIDTGRGTADTTLWWYMVYSDEGGFEGESVGPIQEPGETLDTFMVDLFAGGDAVGWNFVSFNIELADTNLETILAGIDGSYDKVMYYDASTGEWSSYVPGRAAHYNNLGTWDHHMGLWIHATVDDTLTVEGTAPVSTDITLYPGWNMVGLPSSTAGNHGLPTQVSKIGYFSGVATYNLAYDYDPALFEFNPGQGYMVYLDNADPVIWTVDY